MRAGLEPADLLPHQFAPSLADALADQTLQYRLDFDAGRIRRRPHGGLGFDDGHAIVDCEAQADIVNGLAGLQHAAITVVLDKGLGVDQPGLDFPQPVMAQVALAFDRSPVHQAAPLATVLVAVRHLLFLADEAHPRRC